MEIQKQWSTATMNILLEPAISVSDTWTTYAIVSQVEMDILEQEWTGKGPSLYWAAFLGIQTEGKEKQTLEGRGALSNKSTLTAARDSMHGTHRTLVIRIPVWPSRCQAYRIPIAFSISHYGIVSTAGTKWKESVRMRFIISGVRSQTRLWCNTVHIPYFRFHSNFYGSANDFALRCYLCGAQAWNQSHYLKWREFGHASETISPATTISTITALTMSVLTPVVHLDEAILYQPCNISDVTGLCSTAGFFSLMLFLSSPV